MKFKTVKSAKKRVLRVTKNGIVLRRTLSGQHLAAGKSKRTLRNSTKQKSVDLVDAKKIKKMIG